jgi:predicted regulator of Ras-like GTPase activity (Roadblock/LC7/MglB family)
MQTILTALKDIPGVVGSFVLTPQGTLAAREMPAIYPDSIFPELGRRLTTIGEVVDAQMGPMQELLMKFESYWVFVRHTANCLLTVLVADTVNFPALRMATNVALKQLAELPVTTMHTPALVASAPAPATASETSAAPTPVKRRMWRGQWVD